MYCVIGSGPAAVSAATALSARGFPVTIVDAALAPDESAAALRQRFASSEPADWHQADLDALKGRTVATSDGVDAKLDFGSDHVYRDVACAPRVDMEQAEMLRSFAMGGLSNVWGASMLPYPEDEMTDWPFEPSALREHYEAVLKFVPQSGAQDEIAQLFPWTSARLHEMPENRQCQSLLRDLARSRRQLKDQGIVFGTARLAVHAGGSKTGSGCRRCGLCLYGCPYGLIYSASMTLGDLQSKDNVEYRPGLWVHSIEQKRGKLSVHARHVNSGQKEAIGVDRVFLAAGLVETARIVLQSLQKFDTPVNGLHSDRVTVPLLRMRRDKGIRSEAIHTLSQVFLEILDETISQQMIHVQIYGYNDLFPGSLTARLERFGVSSLGKLDDLLLERLMVAFAYFHSNDSSRLEFRLKDDGRLKIRGTPSERAVTATRRLCNKLRRNGIRLRTIVGNGKLHAPGGGNHSGGTFPMVRSPEMLQCDALGELRDLPGLHIVDSSVLPSLSSTTITLPAMANAHRIASEVQ